MRKLWKILEQLRPVCGEIVLNTSCSLLHVPYTLRNETKLAESYQKHFAFAEEKLEELAELSQICASAQPQATEAYQKNQQLFCEDRHCSNTEVQRKVAALTEADFVRKPALQNGKRFSRKHSSCRCCLPQLSVHSRRQRKSEPIVLHSERARSPRNNM